MYMSELIHYKTIPTKIRSNHTFFDTYATIPNHDDPDSHIIVGHMGYNFSERRNTQDGDIACLNMLSSIYAAMNGRLLHTLWEIEYELYRKNLPHIQKEHIPRKIWALILEELIVDMLPPDIHYLCIIIAEKAQKALERYYMDTGERFVEEWKIVKASFYGWPGYNEWVCYQIREIQS